MKDSMSRFDKLCRLMRHLDLFSGIGGFSLAASWVWGEQHEIVAFCEKDKFCQNILKKHWPDVACIDDIHNLKGETIGQIDLLTAGFPCQPFSVAGQRRGTDDDRYLWPETCRVIKETHPHWVLLENVTGIVAMALDEVLADLENEDYETQTFIIPACAVNAPHRRDRVWIIARSSEDTFGIGRRGGNNGNQRRGECSLQTQRPDTVLHEPVIANTERKRLQRGASGQSIRLSGQLNRSRCYEEWDWTKDWIEVATRFCRMGNGVPDRTHRLRALGNAIVPQVAEIILRAIAKTMEGH